MCAGCANETCACKRPMKMHTSQDGRRVDSDGNADSALLKSEELVDVCADRGVLLADLVPLALTCTVRHAGTASPGGRVESESVSAIFA